MQCSFTYGYSGAAFMSSRVSFVTAKQHRYRSGVCKCTSFLTPTINVSVTLSMSVAQELGIDEICG